MAADPISTNGHDPALIDIPAVCNRDVVLGQVVQAVNALTTSNKEDHDKIFARLDEGDKYLFVFKASKCTLSWLNRNGFIKIGLLSILTGFIGWLLGFYRVG